jgi:hypothetical protein
MKRIVMIRLIPLIGMAELNGEDKELAYMRAFSKQGPILHNGYTKISQLLAAGEFSLVAFMQVTKLEKIRERNGPVDWLPLDPRATRGNILNSSTRFFWDDEI